MTKQLADNYEDVTVFGLEDDAEAEMLALQKECTFIWSNKEGWPVGVIMSYVFRDGKFWLTASSQRARMSAVKRDPRVCIVVTSTGTEMGANRTVTYKGTCKLLDDRATKDWFYRELAQTIRPDDAEAADLFEKFLDSPRRLVMEVTPTQRIGYDGRKMGKATREWMEAQKSGETGGAHPEGDA
ncbi:MAG: pyridoxamine 5'-phosphate oxidase family protein [Ilumatobacter sp.]|uniref:pyridoxamine 5'-phosphate oxidase family protein n=1 Tax=Ilumatobacter sp. TaxID=1967498 RepID=UPI003296900A